MINLMYVVLMAMLAMNVSSDVLKGFALVDEGLNRSKDNSAMRNEAIYTKLEAAMKQNPEKARQWHQKGQQVRQMGGVSAGGAEEQGVHRDARPSQRNHGEDHNPEQDAGVAGADQAAENNKKRQGSGREAAEDKRQAMCFFSGLFHNLGGHKFFHQIIFIPVGHTGESSFFFRYLAAYSS